METRQKTEYKIYVLNLANMHGGVDGSEAVALFDDIEKLKSYYTSQLADSPYTDTPSKDSYGQTHSWYKVFKKGSDLEWFNPAHDLSVRSYQEVGFGGVTENWTDEYPAQVAFRIPFNPT